MSKSFILRTVSLIIVMVLAFTACGTSEEEQAPEAFIYGIEMDPGDNINVITTANRVGLMVVKAVYSPLYSYNAEGITWYLAESITPSENATIYTAKLREDVLWNDGTAFTAEDVVFTFETMLSTPDGWANEQLRFGEEQLQVKKIDDYQVEFIFPSATPAAMELLSNIFIMPKHIYENETDIENSAYNANPVGTGPYVLTEYRAGEYLEFSANEQYFDETAKIEKLIFRVVTDSNAARIALKKGEINALTAQATDMPELQGTENITAYPFSEGRVAYMVFNTKSAYMQNEEIRKGIMYALNREEINIAAFISNDYYETIYTFLPANNPFANPNAVEKYEQDTAMANSLLESGVIGYNMPVSGLKLKLAYFGANTPQQKQAAVIQQQLQAVGITVEVFGLDPNVLDAEMMNENSEYDMFLGGYIIGVDPGMYADMFVSGSIYNYSHISNLAIDGLFAEAAIEADEKAREEIYTVLQTSLQDLGVFYPMADNKRVLVVTSNVGGIEESGLVPVFTIQDFSKLYFK